MGPSGSLKPCCLVAQGLGSLSHSHLAERDAGRSHVPTGFAIWAWWAVRWGLPSLSVRQRQFPDPRKGRGGSGRPYPLSRTGGWGMVSRGRADLSCRWLSRPLPDLPCPAGKRSLSAPQLLGGAPGRRRPAVSVDGESGQWDGRPAAERSGLAPRPRRGHLGVLGVPGEDACLPGWGLRPTGHQASRRPQETGRQRYPLDFFLLPN